MIAEEVAEVMPDLVAYNDEGEPETVKYHILPALLINELQRQQRRIDLQDGAIQDLKTTVQIQERAMATQATELHRLHERLAQLEAALTGVRDR